MKTLHDRSILFEIIEKRSGKAVESFAFSLPPFSIQTSIAQRENITDTFDGVFVDDWGLGNQTMTITGTTGGTRIKTYRRGEKEVSASGAKELFDFRDKIIKYKTNNSVKSDLDSYEVRFFDLTLSGGKDFLSDAYVVRLVNFEIQRSKEKPKDFDYSIELFCVRSLFEKPSLLSKGKEIKTQITSQIQEEIEKEENKMKEALNRIEEARKEIQAITKEADIAVGVLGETRAILSSSLGVVGDCVASVNRYVEVGQDGLNLVYEVFDGTTNEIANSMDFVQKIVAFPLKIAKDSIKSVTNMVYTLVKKSKKLEEESENYLQFSLMVKEIAVQSDEIVKGVGEKLRFHQMSLLSTKIIQFLILNTMILSERIYC